MTGHYLIRFDDFYVGMDPEKFKLMTKWIEHNNIAALLGLIPA